MTPYEPMPKDEDEKFFDECSANLEEYLVDHPDLRLDSYEDMEVTGAQGDRG